MKVNWMMFLGGQWVNTFINVLSLSKYKLLKKNIMENNNGTI